jgi:hypothetical protein
LGRNPVGIGIRWRHCRAANRNNNSPGNTNNNIGFRPVRSSEGSPQREQDSDPAAIPSAPSDPAWQNENARPVPVGAVEAAPKAPWRAHSDVGPRAWFNPFPKPVPVPNRTARRAVPAIGRRWHRAGNARRDLELQSGNQVATPANFKALPESQARKLPKPGK